MFNFRQRLAFAHRLLEQILPGKFNLVVLSSRQHIEVNWLKLVWLEALTTKSNFQIRSGSKGNWLLLVFYHFLLNLMLTSTKILNQYIYKYTNMLQGTTYHVLY